MGVFQRKETNLDEGGTAEEEAKHVSHDVITDHTGYGDNKPIQRGKRGSYNHATAKRKLR